MSTDSETKELSKKELENVIYNYTLNANELEEENKVLRETIGRLTAELDRLKSPPLMVCEVSEVVDGKAIIRVPNGNKFFVNISDDCKRVVAGDTVLADQKNLMVLSKITKNKSFDVERFVILEKPKVKWSHIGGLKDQITELKEVVELPLTKPDLFKKLGIQPPKGILLYGPPGTGKTLLAKAIATSTKSNFIEVVGSELVQKFIGEGAKLVSEIFQLAREKAPSIVFIDEIDALAAKRIELGTSGEREVQRTFMQFLAELDGFKPLGNIKVIGCTNRMDILDPAILRPGRFDRVIHVPQPSLDGIKQIFKIHSKQMKLNKDVKMDKLFKRMEGMSGAEIKAVCTEAGYFAIRDNRFTIKQKDFKDAIGKVKGGDIKSGDHKKMFG